MKKLIGYILIFLIPFLLFNACTKEIESISISASNDLITANNIDVVILRVKTSDGLDITGEAEIFLNDKPFAGNSFTSEKAGMFYFYANWNSLKSNNLLVEVTPQIIHKKNVLVEQYTGTWCGYCPRVSNAIKITSSVYDMIIPVGIHDDNDMLFSRVGSLTNTFKVEGYPTAMIDRDYAWPYPETPDGLNKAINKKAICGLKLETSLNETTGNINVEVEFAKGNITKSNLVVFITEDKLYFDQANYYDDGNGNPIKNYEHNNVLRLSLTNLLGDAIPDNFIDGSEIYSHDFSFSTGNYKPENLNIVAFVVEPGSLKSLNARKVKLGGNASFQYK